MIREFVALKSDIEALKSAFGNSMRVGPVKVVDPEKGFRISFGAGTGGNEYLSPWYPHPESGGKTSTWMPLSEGQIVGIINPTGDPRQGVLLRGGFSDQNPPPSQSLSENVFVFGGVKITIAEDGSVIIDAASKVVVSAPAVELGGAGGKAVARIGDRVAVSAGSSAGLWPIVEGSGAVRAVD